MSPRIADKSIDKIRGGGGIVEHVKRGMMWQVHNKHVLYCEALMLGIKIRYERHAKVP